MRYFLDTNIWIFCLRGKAPGAWRRINALPPNRIVLALQSYAELRVGVEKCTHPQRELIKVQAMISPYSIVLPTARTAERYAAIRADLERRGLSISEQDLWVAAVALDENGVVVTNNVTEFRRIPGLHVEDWTVE